MYIIFILGLSNDTNNSKLLQEQKVYGDLLQLNVQENWKRLVLKSLGFLDWAASHVNSSFVAKADVDSFLNISSILLGLESIGDPDKLSNIPTIYGSLVKGSRFVGMGTLENTGHSLLQKGHVSRLSFRRCADLPIKSKS